MVPDTGSRDPSCMICATSWFSKEFILLLKCLVNANVLLRNLVKTMATRRNHNGLQIWSILLLKLLEHYVLRWKGCPEASCTTSHCRGQTSRNTLSIVCTCTLPGPLASKLCPKQKQCWLLVQGHSKLFHLSWTCVGLLRDRQSPHADLMAKMWSSQLLCCLSCIAPLV